MDGNREIGIWGEETAIKFLRGGGYQILERNWKFSYAEIDIICKFQNILVFVEVKTRSYDYYGQPEDFLSDRQKEQIVDAATQYMREVQYEWAFRFDVIAILRQNSKAFEIKHFEDAFFPGIQ